MKTNVRRGIRNLSQRLQWEATALKNRRKKPGRPVFILGTGRSGTHFLARTLIRHPSTTDLTGGEENPLVFHIATSAALGAIERSRAITALERRYRLLLNVAAPLDLVDQTHPNIWLAPELANQFPSARFLGLIRNPYSVVHSMLNHSGVLRWIDEWESFPIPNRFLGIDASNAGEYRDMSLAEKCALRWSAHYVRLHSLKPLLGQRLHILSYEHLCLRPAETLRDLQAFLEYGDSFPLPSVETASLRKWETLSDPVLDDIRRVTMNHAERGALDQVAMEKLESLLATEHLSRRV